jgi:integrase
MSKAYSTPHPSSRKPADPVQAEPLAPPRVKPAKPYPEFPLYSHPSGRWAKKIRGHFFYFGRWEDPDAALQEYLEQKDALHAGRTPRPAHDALTVKQACNAYLNEKQARVEAGELCQRTFNEYQVAAKTVLRAFGRRRVADLGPDDFATLRRRMAAKFGPVRLGNQIQSVRSIFKYAYDADLIDRPMRFGPAFVKPSAKTLRLHRAKQGPKLFSAEEIRRMLDAADPQFKAMVLLGINCGFGMSDCGKLPLSAVNLDAGMIEFPRPKTGVGRRCPLWPETVEAIRDALAVRPNPKDPADAELVFLTAQGRPWNKTEMSSPAVFKFAGLLRRLGIKRPRIGFYTLRHTFRTQADESRDQPAVDFIMGHIDASMAGHYRERISDERLRAVAEHVRAWLFAEPEPNAETPAGEEPRILKIEIA